MAESIYTQLENQTVLTPVDGKDFRHPLPAGLFPTDKQFESETDLIAWAEENDYTYPLIQKGLQKAIIEVRAAFKSCPKDKVWSEDLGLKNIDDMVWKIVDRPNTGGTKSLDAARFNDCMKMISNLTMNGMDSATIRTMVTPIYGEEVVDTIFTELEALA
ncbi:MAG: hypothetical protein KKF42_09005 [Actinobacteria bacterium]|nr:hypothetical protein [Actinomycetota bacterium]